MLLAQDVANEPVYMEILGIKNVGKQLLFKKAVANLQHKKWHHLSNVSFLRITVVFLRYLEKRYCLLKRLPFS